VVMVFQRSVAVQRNRHVTHTSHVCSSPNAV
jgi:hypothetical protein